MVIFLILVFALLFGIVEGITEWLPISSTGHMILLKEILTLFGFDLSSSLEFTHGEDFLEMFLVVIQFGAILAVIVYFFNKLWPFGKKKISEEEEEKVSRGEVLFNDLQKEKHLIIWKRWLKTLIGILPAFIVGLIFEIFDLEKVLENWITIGITLIVYGVLFVVIETYLEKQKREVKYKSIDDLPLKIAFYIGCFQVLALIPGTSRSGVTILGALILFSGRETAAEYSFYLSIPIMFGASLLKIVKFFIDFGNPTGNEWLFLVSGMVFAFGISLLVVRWLMSFLKKHNFKCFGYYRIILGIIVLLVFGIDLALKS